MEFERRIRKVGNSLGFNLPAEMLRELDIKEGDKIFLSVENNSIVIRSEKMKEDNKDFKDQVLAIIEEYMKEKDKKC